MVQILMAAEVSGKEPTSSRTLAKSKNKKAAQVVPPLWLMYMYLCLHMLCDRF
jgi:hypothetical protein